MKQSNYIDISKFTEDDAREYLESVRWVNDRICPHCGFNTSYKLEPKKESKRPVRKGVYKCKKCRKQFTVTVGTIFAESHIPLNKWLIAVHLMCSSKKGISANQLHRMLGITYKSAWFMAHRVRYAMEHIPLDKLIGIVEVDETYIGGKHSGKRGRGSENKIPVVSLVQRDGTVRSKKFDNLTAKNLKNYIKENVDKSSIIVTDEFRSYNGLAKDFSKHYVVNHGRKEYVRGEAHTNTAEGYFSLLKRGVNGTFHHISKKHLQKYLAEFDFRYNLRKLKDGDITPLAVRGIEGKRLMYRDS